MEKATSEMSDVKPATDEQGQTVVPQMGLRVLERAKEAIYDAFRDQGDSPASAVATAIVGYRNAIARIDAEIRERKTSEKLWREQVERLAKDRDAERARAEAEHRARMLDNLGDDRDLQKRIAALEAENVELNERLNRADQEIEERGR